MMKLLRVDEVAALLGLKVVTVRQMIRAGKLQVVRPTGPGGRAVRLRADDIERLIAGGSAQSAK